MSAVDFKIISASSKFSDHIGAPKILESHTPQKPPPGAHGGWISARNCIYPQELLIHLDSGGSDMIKLKKIEILSHHFLIATRIEFFISTTGDSFKRLGYVKLSDNQQTSFKARELKSVHISATGRIVKIIVHDCFPNQYNPDNQVGIVAVGIHGTAMKPEQVIADDIINESLSKRNRTPLSLIQNPSNNVNAIDLLYSDQEIGEILQQLESEKRLSLEAEKYDTCQKIKEVQSFIQSQAESYKNLHDKKQQSLVDEDYVSAKRVKIQLDEIRLVIIQKVKNSNIFAKTPESPVRKIRKPPSPPIEQSSKADVLKVASVELNEQPIGDIF